MKILIIAENRHNSLGGIETYNNLLIDILSNNNHMVYEYAFNLNPERIDVKKHNDNATPINRIARSDSALSLSSRRKNMKASVRAITRIYKDFDLVIDSSSNVAWPKEIYNCDKWIYVQHFNCKFYKQYYIFSKTLSPIVYFGMWLFGIKNPFNYFKNFVFFSEDDKKSFKNRKMLNSTCIPLARFSSKEIMDLQKSKISSKNKIFVYSGRIDNFQKNIKYIRKTFNDLELPIDFYGSGDKKIIFDDQYCKFLGNFSEANLISTLQKYKFNILFSKFEGFPYSIVEAMSMGLVCVTTNCFKSSHWILKDNGFIITKKNISDILNVCKNMSNEKYAILSNKCFQFAIDHFSIESFTNKWIEFINKLAKR